MFKPERRGGLWEMVRCHLLTGPGSPGRLHLSPVSEAFQAKLRGSPEELGPFVLPGQLGRFPAAVERIPRRPPASCTS